MVRQYRFSRVAGLTFRVWLRNLIPFTLLSMLLSVPLVILLVLDDYGFESSGLLLSLNRSYRLVVLQGLISLLTPMITAHVVQSLEGVELSLVRSILLSWRGVLTMFLFALLGFFLSFLPVLGVIASLTLGCIGFVAIPAAIAERLDPLAALESSSILTRRRFWTTAALMLAFFVIAAIPYGAMPALVVGLYEVTPRSSGGMDDMIERLRQLRPYAIALVTLTSVLLPLHGIVRAVSYVLLRRDSAAAQGLAQVFE